MITSRDIDSLSWKSEELSETRTSVRRSTLRLSHEFDLSFCSTAGKLEFSFFLVLFSKYRFSAQACFPGPKKT